MTRCTHTTKGGALCKNNCAKGLIACYNHSSECPVCLEKLGTGGETSTLSCGHAFHSKCIDTWLTRDYRCPCCREAVELRGHKYRPNQINVILTDQDNNHVTLDTDLRNSLTIRLRDMFDDGELPSANLRVIVDSNYSNFTVISM